MTKKWMKKIDYFSLYSPSIWHVFDYTFKELSTFEKDWNEYYIWTVQFKHSFIFPLSSIAKYVIMLDIYRYIASTY